MSTVIQPTNNFDYYEFQKKMVISKINEEIQFYEKAYYRKVNPIFTYEKYLKSRIGSDKEEYQNYRRMDGPGRFELKKMNMDEYGKDLDALMFKRPWNKLKEFHKVMKIKEFVDELKFGSKINQTLIDQNKKFIKDEIYIGLKNKKFNKNKSEIEYDVDNMKIISISSLEFNKNTGTYIFDWGN